MNTIADEMIALGWTKAARVARIRSPRVLTR